MSEQQNNPNPNNAEIAEEEKPNTKARAKGFAILALIVGAGIIGFISYEKLFGSRYVETDNAYAAAETAQITPVINGTIEQLLVKDTQYVNKGDLIATLGSSDQMLALREAQAQFGMAVRKITGAMASDKQFGAQILARDADIRTSSARLEQANNDFEKAKIEYQRRQNLVGSGAVSGDELTNAKAAYDNALANLNLAKAQIEQAKANKVAAEGSRISNAASFANAGVDDNPEVMLAKTRVEQAEKDLHDTEIRAPISGVVAKRSVQIGQKVQAGMALMEIVPVDTIHIDANFKESQLKNVKIGQNVEVTSDLYGDKVKYHGKVTGIAGGTGAAFSVIPPQNASGNWIKVVQRLPVRIDINPEDLKAHPLKIGLSMDVKIDTKTNDKSSK
ncbi:HlyD family secretion protein [Pseudaquidulcibacter saccharophilus]|uniref:HlyD family secretion protein n=1 Tax=Pseudaquidulcibacter saccharophilus TaxID=2831900 RepID=UPI001EFF138F|nr:HlyD family secretion protein [Pseudaquidulcibacter saccharophilus]